MHSSTASVLLTLLHLTNGHFSLTTRDSLGLIMATEDTAPCGGASYSTDAKASDYHVGGDAVGVKTGQPQANILIRASLDT